MKIAKLTTRFKKLEKILRKKAAISTNLFVDLASFLGLYLTDAREVLEELILGDLWNSDTEKWEEVKSPN